MNVPALRLTNHNNNDYPLKVETPASARASMCLIIKNHCLMKVSQRLNPRRSSGWVISTSTVALPATGIVSLRSSSRAAIHCWFVTRTLSGSSAVWKTFHPSKLTSPSISNVRPSSSNIVTLRFQRHDQLAKPNSNSNVEPEIRLNPQVGTKCCLLPNNGGHIKLRFCEDLNKNYYISIVCCCLKTTNPAKGWAGLVVASLPLLHAEAVEHELLEFGQSVELVATPDLVLTECRHICRLPCVERLQERENRTDAVNLFPFRFAATVVGQRSPHTHRDVDDQRRSGHKLPPRVVCDSVSCH